MKLISFIGIERADFAYYVAAMLKALKSTVLVIDNSISGDLFYSVTRNNEEAKDCNVIEYENIAFIRGLSYNEETLDKFDYVVCYNGWAPLDGTVFASNYVFVMPDYHLDSLDLAKNAIAELSTAFEDDEDDTNRIFIIMRDLVSEKITDMSVASYVETNVEKIIGHITIDPIDHARQIAFEYNGRQCVKGASPDFEDALAYVVMQVTDKNEKVVKKLLKKA